MSNQSLRNRAPHAKKTALSSRISDKKASANARLGVTTLTTKQQRDQLRMLRAVAYLSGYLFAYDKQVGYSDYRDETFINDVLYGLGVALGGAEHEFANGFDVWKAKLRTMLGDGWKPIETAPKDGTRVQLYRVGYAEATCIGWWSNVANDWVPVHGTAFPDATHWQPVCALPHIANETEKANA